MRTSTKLLTLALLGIASVLSMAPTIMFVQPASAPAGPADPTLLWWKFSEGSGTALNDSSVANADGTTNATWSGTTLDFNGTDDVAYSDSAVTYGVQVVTLTFWLNPDSVGSAQIVFESGDDWAEGSRFLIFITASGRLEARISDSGAAARTEDIAISATTNVFWSIVLDQSTSAGDLKIYKDGSLQSESLITSDHSAATTFAAEVLHVMARNGETGGAALFVGGVLDDVRIYSGEVSAGDIATIFAAGAQ